MVIVAIDWVRWTGAAQKTALEIRQRAKDELGATKLELQLTGRVSDRARRELEALGYTVTEGVPHTVQTSAALNPAK